MMAKNNYTSFIFTSLLYICGLILFLEWLYPMKVFDQTSNLYVFIIYSLYCFLIALLNIRWFISVLLKGFGLLFIIFELFIHEPLFSKTWFEELFAEMIQNIHLLMQQNWFDLTMM